MVPLQFLGSFGFQELLVILLIVIVLFGARRIPEIARGLGQGIRGFRSAVRGEEDQPPRDERADERPKSPRQP